MLKASTYKLMPVAAYVTILLMAANGPEKIKPDLEAAKAAHEAAIQKAEAVVLDALQKKEDVARKSGDKTTVDAVKAERDAFKGAGELPKSMKLADYRSRRQRANLVLADAYRRAVREYTKSGNDGEADAVQGELDAFLKDAAKDGPPPKATKTPKATRAATASLPADPMVGRWLIRDKELKLSPADFARDGSIVVKMRRRGQWSTTGRGGWQLTEKGLMIRWEDLREAEGVRTEQATLSKDGTRYEGRFADGLLFYGVKLANEEEVLRWEEGIAKDDSRKIWKNPEFYWINTKPGIWQFRNLPWDGNPTPALEEIIRTDRGIVTFNRNEDTWVRFLGDNEARLITARDKTWQENTLKGRWVDQAE